MVQGCYASQPRSTEYSPPLKVDTKRNEETTGPNRCFFAVFRVQQMQSFSS